MITIRLVNDANISDTDFANVAEAVKYYVPLVTAAWKMEEVKVEAGGAIVDGDWVVYLTEQNRHKGASGYHTVYKGVPVAYCSLRASGRLYGTYIKPLVLRGKTIHGPLYTPGLVTTICHEVAEMLCDPYITTVSSVDFKGRNWLVEVCDHVFGSYKHYTVNGKNCILPDVTTPEFYKQDGKAPYSIFGAPVAPFVMTPKGYAYYQDASGKLVKIV